MTDDPTAQDFDWVTARLECLLPNEFERLRLLVEENCCTRRKSLPADNPVDLTFCGKNGDDMFIVTRRPAPNIHGSTYDVTFSLRNDHILIEDGWSKPKRTMTIKLTLNDDGQCRYVVDGEGEHLRWQVARKAIYGLFFEAPRPS